MAEPLKDTPSVFHGRYLIIARFAAPDARGSGVRPEKETTVGQRPGVMDTPGVFHGRYLIIARFAAPDAQGSGVRPVDNAFVIGKLYATDLLGAPFPTRLRPIGPGVPYTQCSV